MRRKVESLFAEKATFLLLGLILFATSATPVLAEDWLGWRGLRKQGWSQESGHPTNWSRSELVLWRTPIQGEGYSSPVVVGNQVFVTTAYESQKAAFWHKLASLVKYSLALVATLIAVSFLSSSSAFLREDGQYSRRALVSGWLFLVLWETVVMLCFFGECLFD